VSGRARRALAAVAPHADAEKIGLFFAAVAAFRPVDGDAERTHRNSLLRLAEFWIGDKPTDQDAVII